jgi:hypothetical protein
LRESHFTIVFDLGSIGFVVNDSAVHGTLDRSAVVGTFVSLLAAGDGDVRASLAAVLGRPDLTIAYWLPGAEGCEDRDVRRQFVDMSEPGLTVVSHRGQRVAALFDDPPLPDGPELGWPLMAAVGLAHENERLQVALHARA